jgi:hypothetical protein
MIHKVSVVKKITYLMMTMALAVALVACESATGAQGDLGPQGDPGDTGPAGPSGTTDNEPPMAVPDKPFKDVYLALGGDGKKNPSDPIDPSGHFMDKENASLTYKAESSAEDVATVKVDAGKLTITGETAGMTTIMVTAYDGVNADPGVASFDVMVVSNNAPPVVAFPSGSTFIDTEVSALGTKIYKMNGDSMVTVMVSIDAGSAGNLSDEVTVKAVMGAKGDKDDIVSVGLAEKKRGTWEITLTPKASGKQNVELMVEDKFGQSVAFGEAFIALVNTVPELANPLSDRTIAVDSIGTLTSTTPYLLAEFFDLNEKAPTGADGDAVAGESTVAPTPETGSDSTCTASMNDVTVATVATDATTATVTAVKAGEAELTITCGDTEGSVSATAMVTVR